MNCCGEARHANRCGELRTERVARPAGFSDNALMNDNDGEHEVCAVCGEKAEGDRWFCHFYNGQNRVTLCSPACAETFLHRPQVIPDDGTIVRVAAETKLVGAVASNSPSRFLAWLESLEVERAVPNARFDFPSQQAH
jgi:hypothetical protein